ncbi:MAG: aerial mycelium formation protein [Catenulispora sp.]
MGTHATRLDRVLAAARRPAAEVEALDVAVIRRERGEARQEETELSYLRRVLHGRIDIIDAELRRRAAGSRAPLVESLAAILADDPPANARSPRHLDIVPAPEPGEYRSQMEERIDAAGPAIVLDLSDDRLAAARLTLKAYEREVSEYRRVVLAVIDRFAAELTRRYREGQATVDDLLNEEQKME